MDNKSMYTQDNANQGGYQQGGYQQSGYQQGGYQQNGYQQNQTYNTGYQVNSNQQPTNGVRCPGKEIAGMILGISALACGVFAVIYCWIPMVSYMGIVMGIMAVVCGIVAMVLHKQVHAVATIISKKINIGKKLGLAGIITGGVGILFGIIMTIVYAAVLASYYSYF